MVVDLDRVYGVQARQPFGRRQREVVEPGVQHDHERPELPGPPDRLGVVTGRGRLEVQGQPRGLPAYDHEGPQQRVFWKALVLRTLLSIA